MFWPPLKATASQRRFLFNGRCIQSGRCREVQRYKRWLLKITKKSGKLIKLLKKTKNVLYI